ncbi:response regulator [Aquibacillus koreensis]|uniref:Response regulator n=1 Tax=Aquibacillus koreensis TaxID=279446 RepID=A0A9X3WMT4_9BACI|nr:response regulator [Aquibacillus koreensis]MCT2536741.1 response regulator [Aquibacillus koreensis]MDC3421503.1 response regulator [Aquibacillus koreensis]
MLKVMLVDDEPIEREGLKLMLSRNRNNFEVVAEAQNGIEAVDFALQHKPDLIFMDIKMPVCDGLEAIKKIAPELPETKYIMVSAFDTFEYAREAMKFGVKSYLLKPSKLAEVLEAYDQLVTEIEAEKQTLQERKQVSHRLERASSFIEKDFIVSLMMDHLHDVNQAEWDEWIDIEGKQGFMVVFSFESDSLQPKREEKSKWYQTLQQVLLSQSPHCIIGPLTGFQVPVLVLSTETDHERSEDFVRMIIHQVQHHLEQCRLFAGVGSIVSDVGQFTDSYKEAIYALELVHNHSNASYMVYDERTREKQQVLVPFEVEKELVEAVKQGDTQKGLHVFDTYFQSIHQATEFQLRHTHKAIEDFFVVLTRAIKDLGFDQDMQVSLGRIETAMQLKEAAKSRLLFMMDRIKEWRASGIQSLLLQAKEYIDKNYGQSISLEEVADHIGISSYYLSKLFKDRFELSFIEYLTDIRMKKAKAFLMDGSIPLKEIALNIGYKDPNYFSRVFKKEFDVSPREYRNKNQE